MAIEIDKVDPAKSRSDTGVKRRGLLRFGTLITAFTGASAISAIGAPSAQADPIDTATLQAFVPISEKGVASGVACLDLEAKVPRTQLPDLSVTTAQEVSTPGKPARIALDTLYAGKGERHINVLDYGAKGDGEADDTAAFQAAINTAIIAKKTLLLPPPPGGNWVIKDTLIIQPVSTTPINFNIEGQGQHNSILWLGDNNKPVFRAMGWKSSAVRNVQIQVSSATGVVCWDLDTTATLGSLTRITFDTCATNLGTGMNNVGWRMGHNSLGGGDISFIQWNNCSATGGGDTAANTVSGQRGWVNEGGNSLNLLWIEGIGSFLETMVTNRSTPGAASAQGGGCLFFYGLGGGYNGTDFEFSNISTYVINGGRFELGKRWINVTSGTNHTTVTVTGAAVNDYDPSAGVLVNFGRPGTLILQGCIFRRTASDYPATAFTLGGSNGRGSFIMRGGIIRSVDLPVTYNLATWNVIIEGVGKGNGVNQSPLHLPPRRGAYSESMSYSGAGTSFTLDCLTHSVLYRVSNDAMAFTFANPLNPSQSRKITYVVINNTTRAMGAINWGGTFRLGGAFASPAAGKRKTISFMWDGTRWIEMSRSADM